MAKSDAKGDLFRRDRILALSPDDASIPAAEKVLKKGGFGTVEATADGKGWWVVCRGLTDTYQVSVRAEHGTAICTCTCPSPKYPCKHALALLLYLSAHPEERAEPEAPRYAPGDFEALLRAVFENPDDDTPRLVFADFLDENDQPDRAALIRLQCELDRAPARSSRAKELKADEKRLLAKLRPTVGTLPEDARATFHRGFLHLSLVVAALPEDVGSLPERFARLFRDGWVEVVRFGEVMDEPLTEDQATLYGLAAELDFTEVLFYDAALLSVAARTAEMRATGRLRRVRVGKRYRKEFDELTAARAGKVASGAGPRVVEEHRRCDGLTRQSLDLLIRAGRLRTARRLTLAGQLGAAEAEVLAAADLAGVEELHLDYWEPGPDGLAALADSPGLPDLDALAVTHSRLDPPAVAALARGRLAARLQRLDLRACELSDAALARLADSPFPALRDLQLDNNALTAGGVAALLRSPNFPALTEVGVYGNQVDDRKLLPLLLGAPDRPELALTTGGVAFRRRAGPDGVRVAVEANGRTGDPLAELRRFPGAERVVGLRVLRFEVGSAGLRAAAKAFDPAALRELEFREVPLKNDGAEALVAAFAGYRPEVLRLSFCRVQAGGTAALADSPLLDSVKVLDLSGNGIGKAGAAALVKSGHLARLERLELTGGRLGADELKALKAKFGKKLVL